MAAAGVLGAALFIALPGPAVTPAVAGQPGGGGEPTPQTDASVPASDVTMIGSSPQEAPGETWGFGRYDGASAIVRYTTETGWSLMGGPLGTDGQPLAGFELAHPEGFKYPDPSPLAGQITPNGSGALLGTIPAPEVSGGLQQLVLVREPGGAFKETAPLPAGLLKEGESLFGLNQAPIVAALEEGGAAPHAGALVVPVDEGGNVDSGVLHWNGEAWTREPIEIPAATSKEFQVIAIGASSPQNAWLIARLSSSYPTGSVALFRRHLGGAGETPTWLPVAPKPGGEPGGPLSVKVPKAEGPGEEEKQFTVPSGDQSQILTVTGEGVWIDGLRRDAHASTTMFFKPAGEAAGEVLAAWCELPAGAPEGTPPCKYDLPEALSTEHARSFAWATGGFGERVITGFADGVSLRLEGTEFRSVLALGGSSAPADVGGTFGAAFSGSREGWLGQENLPVHLTLTPAASRLTPWPVSFHDALLALAPQPDVPVGSLSSEALAVGDQGEVARYRPGQGWLPESLLGAGGRRETPRLRSVAWPTPSRAYAVGVEETRDEGQMWLWRAETGLWERDPATPQNFRGSLLGIAFDPGETARGYAVGQGGVLLRYGKTWTQERTCEAGVPQPCLPPEVAGANFTSIAFAGSEAIVAYRKLPDPSRDSYEGGLIVNDGSGWQLDQGAAQAMGADVPWAVAALPDGGAAVVASGAGEGARIYEREAAGAQWQATATPYPPGGGTPGSLAVFREGGALRAITAGTEPDTYQVEDEPSPPPGFPPALIRPYPVGSNPEHGVIRQTATGWSDQEHELNNAREPPGGYVHYDTVYEPDPVTAVTVDPTGSQGWAVGGVLESEHPLLDTADVWRYPADGTEPVGVKAFPVSSERGVAEFAGEPTFAIAGGAQCAAPCATRANARIGPDVWLSAALSRASEIKGMSAFLYTGPRVTTGEVAGLATLPIPYPQEFARYAEILRASPVKAYAAASPTDLAGTEGEGAFEEAFGGSGLPAPFGEPKCHTSGCQSAYFAFSSAGVRVIVLDGTGPVSPEQLKWLEKELAAARSTVGKAAEPAIAVGNADLAAQMEAAATREAADSVAEVLVCGHAGLCHEAENGASAYFFDSPEKNVKLPLRAGAASIPSFGSGTLGYVSYLAEEKGDFIGDSGFLLTQVGQLKKANVFTVHVELIPDIEELSMEAKDGTLLRRSQVTQFAALARRPRSGNRAADNQTTVETDPYIPIPSICIGSICESEGLFPEFTFSSSKPEIGGFVKPNLVAEPRGHEVLLKANGEPEREPINKATGREESKSSLFCAYNAGTTEVTISAGGLSYTLPVVVEAGSVRQPCGTVPANKPRAVSQSAPAPVPPPAPAPAGPAPSSSPPLVPVPPPPLLVVAPPGPPTPLRPAAPPTPFFFQPALPFLVPAFVPPPLPAPAEPTPPSGTSAVTSPVEAAQKEEEEEEATESVSNQALAYRAPEHEPSPGYILGIVLLAAFAGASTRRRMRAGRGDLHVAPATLSTMRAQRRSAPRRGRRP